MNEVPARPAGPPDPIPLNVFTGFLGAGKTTLLNRLLRDPAMADTAVLVNEVGEIGIDHNLYEILDEDVILLSSGCLCCAVRGDLVNSLENLLRGRDNGRMTQFKRVVIETTGIADPASVLHVIMTHPYLILRYRLDGVVTLVDAVNGMQTLDNHEEAVKQAAMADRVVLTKTDLLAGEDGAAQLAALRARLAKLNPAAVLLEGEVSAADLIGAGLYDPDKKIPDVSRWLREEAVIAAEEDAHADHDHHHHGHDHHHGHKHDQVSRHDASIKVFSIATEKPVPYNTLEMFLDLMRSAHGEKLLRLKGIVQLADEPERPVVVHVVQHLMHPPARLAEWPDADRRTRLVCVTKDLAPETVRRMFNAFLGVPQVDMPDASALAENPLALGHR